MNTYQLPCMRYGKAGDGQYDILSCADELIPYKNRIREIEFQWKAGDDKAYPPVWYLYLLPGGSYGLLMRFTDTGTEGDLRHRPHTLLKEVALCRRDSHLKIVSAISRGAVPQNECLGSSWCFNVDETEKEQYPCWKTGVLSSGTPGTYTIKAIKSAPPPVVSVLRPPKLRSSSMPGSLTVCASALVLLVLLPLTFYFYHEYTDYKMSCSELHAQVMELQARNKAFVEDGEKANRSWIDKENAWQKEKRKLTQQIEDLKAANAKLERENKNLKQKKPIPQSPNSADHQSSQQKKGESVVKKAQNLINEMGEKFQ